MGVSVSCMQESSIKPRDKTVASRARLEALANVQAKMNASTATDSDEVLANGCRLAYSSALNASSDQEAQALLAGVFTQALTKNPPKQIGGMLFYDEQTHVCVQVLEGPALAVRALYHEKIKKDDRHNSVRLLWDEGAETRHYDGFGMQLGSDPAQVLQNTSELLQLTYVSQLTASSREEAYKHMESILGVAFVKNPRLGIGGALFLNPRTLQVLQALEGPEANVRRLYEKIAKDARHTECTIVSEVTVKERTYEQWGMLQGRRTATRLMTSSPLCPHRLLCPLCPHRLLCPLCPHRLLLLSYRAVSPLQPSGVPLCPLGPFCPLGPSHRVVCASIRWCGR